MKDDTRARTSLVKLHQSLEDPQPNLEETKRKEPQTDKKKDHNKPQQLFGSFF